MFGFIRRAARKLETGEASLPKLDWDLHAHLLPGVDDGVKTMQDALDAIRALRRLGYTRSVLTPHIYKGLYPNTRETLEPVFADLRATLRSEGIEHELQLAAEYFADEHLVSLAEREPLLSFGPKSSPHVLIEFPYMSEPLLWADALSALVRNGYTPVLAHIERYRFVLQDPKTWLARFEQFSVKVQCNVGSLAGQYGREAFEFARRMRDGNVASFWGTDLHRAKQVESYITPGLTHLTELKTLNASLSL